MARFLLVTGVAPARTDAPGWPARPVLRGSGTGGDWSAWRLLGGNNRELGRSARAYPDAVATLSAIAVLRARFCDIVPAHTTDQRGLWRWRLQLDDDVVVVSSRAYLRQRESHYSLTQFLSVAPDAEAPRLQAAAPLHQPSTTGAA